MQQNLFFKSWNNIHEDCIKCIRVSGNSEYLFTASDDGCIKVWDIETGKLVRNFSDCHKGWVRNIGLSLCGNFLWTSSEDKCLKKWKVDRKSLGLKTDRIFVRAWEDPSSGNTIVCMAVNG